MKFLQFLWNQIKKIVEMVFSANPNLCAKSFWDNPILLLKIFVRSENSFLNGEVLFCIFVILLFVIFFDYLGIDFNFIAGGFNFFAGDVTIIHVD